MRKWIFPLVAVIAIAVGAYLMVMGHKEAERARTDAQIAKLEEQANKIKERRENEAKNESERDERYDELIAEGQRKRDDGDTSGALDALSQALAVAKTNSQKYEAFALRAEALDGNDDERQKKAGNMMYSLAQGDREMAGAYHVIARAEEKLGEYMNAMRDYQKAGELYKSAGMDEMAWLDLAAASRVAEDGAKSHQSAARLWEEAWQMVDEGDMSEEKKNKAYYELCLDRASMAEHAKKWREQLKWHREAARYDPRHEEAADALEAALKRQRKI